MDVRHHSGRCRIARSQELFLSLNVFAPPNVFATSGVFILADIGGSTVINREQVRLKPLQDHCHDCLRCIASSLKQAHRDRVRAIARGQPRLLPAWQALWQADQFGRSNFELSRSNVNYDSSDLAESTLDVPDCGHQAFSAGPFGSTSLTLPEPNKTQV